MDSSFKECLRTQRYFNDKILERLFTVLKEDPEFHKIFCSQNISFDVIYHTVQVENSAFKFKHSNFKQLLIDLDLLYPHPDKNIFKYIVNNKRKRFFDAVILPEIRAKRFGIEELQRQLAQRQIHGDQAENYVMEYEIARLENKKTPERVSLYSINAGYDIMSYDDALAENPNRFIEVKSFVGAPNFFWSSNEIDVARRKKDTYFLYLVDRDQMVHEDYRPLIIRNPIEVVLNDEERWSRRVDSYFIYQT